jgi:hypothetical protein
MHALDISIDAQYGEKPWPAAVAIDGASGSGVARPCVAFCGDRELDTAQSFCSIFIDNRYGRVYVDESREEGRGRQQSEENQGQWAGGANKGARGYT